MADWNAPPATDSEVATSVLDLTGDLAGDWAEWLAPPPAEWLETDLEAAQADGDAEAEYTYARLLAEIRDDPPPTPPQDHDPTYGRGPIAEHIATDPNSPPPNFFMRRHRLFRPPVLRRVAIVRGRRRESRRAPTSRRSRSRTSLRGSPSREPEPEPEAELIPAASFAGGVR
jgi:hypothetical protein